MRRNSGIKQVESVVRHQGPVVMLAGTVDTRKRFLMQQAAQPVPGRDPFQRLHDDLVVIHCDIGFFIDRSELMLGRRRFIVLRLCRHPEPPELLIDILHVCGDPGPDRPEIVVVQLLPLRRSRAEQSAAGKYEIHPFQVLLPVDDEILLFRSHIRNNMGRRSIAEQAQQTYRLPVDDLHRAEKGRLLVQGFPGIRAEGCRDAQSSAALIMAYKSRRGAVPDRVPSRFKRGPKSPGREGRCIRLSLDQFLAREPHEDSAVRQRRGNESVVLLRRNPRKRKEPMSIMRSPSLKRPFLHFMGDDIRGLGRQIAALSDRSFQFLISAFGKPLLHDHVIEYIFAKQVCADRHLFSVHQVHFSSDYTG